MRWTDRSQRLPLQSLDTLAQRVPSLAATASPASPGAGLSIAFTADAHAAALRHLAGHRDECGGLLLGEVFAVGGDPACSRAVLVTQAVAAEEFSGTGISLRMSSSVWERSRTCRGALELVVGWYHSHPGLGAFFSATDRRTQQDFFPHAYSLGWVVDPVSGESAVFVGRDAAPPERVIYGVAGAAAEVTAGSGGDR